MDHVKAFAVQYKTLSLSYLTANTAPTTSEVPPFKTGNKNANLIKFSHPLLMDTVAPIGRLLRSLLQVPSYNSLFVSNPFQKNLHVACTDTTQTSASTCCRNLPRGCRTSSISQRDTHSTFASLSGKGTLLQYESRRILEAILWSQLFSICCCIVEVQRTLSPPVANILLLPS